MSGPRYIPGPSTRGSDAIFIPGNSWEPKGVAPLTVIIITLVIIIALILITFFLLRTVKRDTITLTSGENLLDLSALIDLKTDGQCCLPPSALSTTQEWIYSPSNNFTFSSTKTAPAVVCQGLTGVDLNNCLNYVTGVGGDAKILAHYGVKPYYPFAPGMAGGVCASYGTC